MTTAKIITILCNSVRGQGNPYLADNLGFILDKLSTNTFETKQKTQDLITDYNGLFDRSTPEEYGEINLSIAILYSVLGILGLEEE